MDWIMVGITNDLWIMVGIQCASSVQRTAISLSRDLGFFVGVGLDPLCSPGIVDWVDPTTGCHPRFLTATFVYRPTE